MRVYKHFQFQVILKPAPADVQDLYLESLRAFGIDPARARHPLRGGQLGIAHARGGGGRLAGGDGRDGDLAVHVLPAGGGQELAPISAELTYGIERICMFLNDIRNIFDIPWNDRRDLRRRAPRR